MLSQLTIIHRKKPEVFQELPADWRIFVTCLRSLAIAFSSQDPAELNDEVFRGHDAYRFLLEVACGLQSPIVGETEVFGQLRRFAENWPEQSAFFQNLYADVKSIRQEHLSCLGSLSYGSWVRRKAHSGEVVHVLGTGQLAQEIHIWVGKQNRVCLYSRAPVLASERLRQTPIGESVEIRNLTETPEVSGSVVVIASPLKSDEIHGWWKNQEPRLVIDLRDDSILDRVTTNGHCYRLQDIFTEIESGRSQAQEKVKQARQMIDSIVTKRFQSQVVRPFGWDDLCA
jgi:glutamyl-tRNA reductase